MRGVNIVVTSSRYESFQSLYSKVLKYIRFGLFKEELCQNGAGRDIPEDPLLHPHQGGEGGQAARGPGRVGRGDGGRPRGEQQAGAGHRHFGWVETEVQHTRHHAGDTGANMQR